MTRSAHQQSRSAAPAVHGPADRLTGRSTVRRSLVAAGLAAVAGAALFAANGTAAATETSSTGFSPGDAERSIVSVSIDWTGYVQYPTSSGQRVWSDPVEVQMGCTGWFASEQGHVVTAGHCVDPEQVKSEIRAEFLRQVDRPDLAQTATSWAVEGLDSGLPDRGDVRVVQPDDVEGAVIEEETLVQVLDFQPLPDGDLALLKVNGLTEPTPALAVSTEDPAIGDEVVSIGFPGSVSLLTDQDRTRASFKTGTVSSTQVIFSGAAGTEVNAQVSQGMSGGPTVDADGHVLGVNSFGNAEETQSFNFVTDTVALRSFLDQHGVVVPSTGQAQAHRDGGALGPIGDTASASGPAPSADGGTGDWAYVAGGAVLLLGAGGAYQRTRRGSATASGPALTARADATRLIARPVAGQVVLDPPAARGATCTHAGTPAGARSCPRCGSRRPR